MALHAAPFSPHRSCQLLAALLSCILTLLAATPSSASTLPQSLEQHGLQPINPPTPAIDFELPTLRGSQIKLSDTSGRWVLLTFFATWCGPCMAEMPSLQRFQEQHHPLGVDVLAISGDSSPAPVTKLVRDRNLTFPILMDPQGKVAGQYRATSIPVTYLISPAGELTAVARGARDWSRMDKLVEALLAAHPVTDAPPDAYRVSNEPIELPEILNPPTATIVAPEAPPAPNAPFTLDVRVTWAGNFEEYLLQPPRITVPEGVTQQAMTALSTSGDGNRAVTYRFTFLATEPGSYAFDPVELRYTPRFDPQPVTERLRGPTLSVLAPPLPTKLLVGGAIFSMVLMWGWFMRRRQSSTTTAKDIADESPDALRESLTDARRRRMEGDIAGFLEAIRAMHERFEIDDLTGQRQAIDQWIEETRYGGHQLSGPALDQLERAVERHLITLEPSRDEAEHDAIEYADQPR